MEDIIRQIEAAYGLSIKAVSPAPRGFWAETFYIDTKYETYFLKIHKNYPWESTLKEPLDILDQIANHVNYVPKPIKTKGNSLLCPLDDNKVTSLYTYIDGTQYVTNDACEILNLMAGIYN